MHCPIITFMILALSLSEIVSLCYRVWIQLILSHQFLSWHDMINLKHNESNAAVVLQTQVSSPPFSINPKASSTAPTRSLGAQVMTDGAVYFSPSPSSVH